MVILAGISVDTATGSYRCRHISLSRYGHTSASRHQPITEPRLFIISQQVSRRSERILLRAQARSRALLSAADKLITFTNGAPIGDDKQLGHLIRDTTGDFSI